MIDESDPAVVAMRARFDEISTRHRQSVADTAATYEEGEERNKAYREEVARREADMLAPPTQPVPKNPWLSRRTMPPRQDASDDGSETGYYTNTWME
ncbi:hypothetical protein [Actinocrispum wychmicini]|uniref:Uncharacterized protein n=1 Tax=Actinocrispum wychmicini TaxID=1213861 RepID=A0A4R2JXU3_9PSEU|nr:hypothetical protein [Actinocrispum wychmicini]TCO65393.1 hypothetical protein EV192_1011185 [Actinocrispum wychmicini]